MRGVAVQIGARPTLAKHMRTRRAEEAVRRIRAGRRVEEHAARYRAFRGRTTETYWKSKGSANFDAAKRLMGRF